MPQKLLCREAVRETGALLRINPSHAEALIAQRAGLSIVLQRSLGYRTPLTPKNLLALQQTAGNRATRQLLSRAPAISAVARQTVQRENGDSPSADERKKAAEVGDRHDIPHPYMALTTWYKTLMTGRVKDLYRTAPGFPGHAEQIQAQLQRLIPLIDEKGFRDQATLDVAKEYEADIRRALIAGANEVTFDIPKFVFHFSGDRTIAIERSNGAYTGTKR